MNASQIHLALNHVPLFFSIIGGLILLYGFFKKNDSIKIMSLYLMIGAALFTIPVYLTGEGTEEMVEKLPGVSENMIEEHEEMAKIGLIIIIITGVAALASLFIRQKTGMFKTGLAICVVLSFASFGVMAQTAHLGGQIRHSEIRTGTITTVEAEKENEDDGKAGNKEVKDSLNLMNNGEKKKDEDD